MSVPAQLPPAIHPFAGRSGALADLDKLLPGNDQTDVAGPSAVVIAAVSGTPGVGKTTLAVHWAHRVAEAFPDGQLYVNLRGFDPSGSAMDPAEALRGFLAAFGVPPHRIPTGLDALSASYRSVLAGKQVLVVLDNARDAEQVRPLLPGTPGCLVVVTSRDQLTPLVATSDAHPLTLDLMSTGEGRDLLAHRLGTDRTAAESGAVEEIIARCSRLPLALAIVSARAATHPQLPLASLATELRDAASALGGLHGGDPATDIWTVFSWSYHALSTGAAKLFRLLSLHCGPDIAVPAAASLYGTPVRQVQPLLAELARAHLFIEHAPGRYSCHDLLRTYAAELTCKIDPADERDAATRRLLDHYLHATYAGARLLQPHRDPIDLAPAADGVTHEVLTDAEQAMAWFTAEHPVLIDAVGQATAARLDTHAWQLVWALADFLDRRGHWRDWESTLEVALPAARRLTDRAGEAYVRRGMGRACAQLDRFDDAAAHFQAALKLFGESGDSTGQALSHLNLAWMFGRQGRGWQALSHAREALQLYQAAGHRPGQARALNSLGWQHAQLCDYRRALSYCQQSLALLQQIGDRRGEANTWDSMGYAHHHLGHDDEATTCYERAIELFLQTGDRYYEADTLTHLGDAHQATGEVEAANRSWRRALDILDQLGHPDADQVRAKLKRVRRGATGPS
jgi:tetratricopeptide (TPR) repeat protein